MNKVKQYSIKVIPSNGWDTEYKAFLWYDKNDAKREAWQQWYQIISDDKDIRELEYWENKKPFFYSKKISSKDILLFFELFSNLNNLPISKQVSILKKQARKYIMKLFYEDLSTYISKWKSLYDIISMPKWKKFFSNNQLELIKIWEQTKNLNETIKNLAEEQKNELEVRSSLLMVAVYPMLILITVIIASIILFIYILPMIMSLTGEIELPTLTQILFDVRVLILNYWLIFLWTIIFSLVLIYILIQWYQWRFIFHKILLVLPWIKQLLKARIEMQISKILEFSSSAGMTPLDKVHLLCNWVNNLVYKEYFHMKIKNIERWGKLIEVFSMDKLFSAPMQWYIETWDINKNLEDLMRVHYSTVLWNIQKRVKLIQMILSTLIIFLLWWIVWLFAWWVLQLVLKITESVL